MVDSDLLKKFVKNKKLQKLGNSLVLIIPKTWIKSLSWNQETQLTMSYNIEEGKIIIKKSEEKTGGEDGEEISELVTV